MTAAEPWPAEVRAAVDAFEYPLIFATVSGAHLYGFASPDSDFDLRGCHVLPLRAVLGLTQPCETEEFLGSRGSAIELDLVSHDLAKFGRLLLRRNGYVLEQLLSPLVLRTSEPHRELVDLSPRLITRHHAHHYLGFAQNQWRMFEKAPRVKTLLYVYRVLLTGIHLMASGRMEANLRHLLTDHPVDGIDEWIDAKVAGAEKQALPAGRVAEHGPRVASLFQQLEQARDSSHLPETPSGRHDLDDLVARARITPP